jgi:hypothetical protein
VYGGGMSGIGMSVLSDRFGGLDIFILVFGFWIVGEIDHRWNEWTSGVI